MKTVKWSENTMCSCGAPRELYPLRASCNACLAYKAAKQRAMRLGQSFSKASWKPDPAQKKAAGWLSALKT